MELYTLNSFSKTDNQSTPMTNKVPFTVCIIISLRLLVKVSKSKMLFLYSISTN